MRTDHCLFNVLGVASKSRVNFVDRKGFFKFVDSKGFSLVPGSFKLTFLRQ